MLCEYKKAADSKYFWKTFKLFLPKKTSSSERISPVDDDDPVAKEQKVATTLNDFSSNKLLVSKC